MAVMSPVVSRPPQWSALPRRTGYEGTYELDNSACFKGTVRKVAMVKGGDREHSYQIGKNRDQDAGDGDGIKKGQ